MGILRENSITPTTKSFSIRKLMENECWRWQYLPAQNIRENRCLCRSCSSRSSIFFHVLSSWHLLDTWLDIDLDTIQWWEWDVRFNLSHRVTDEICICIITTDSGCLFNVESKTAIWLRFDDDVFIIVTISPTPLDCWKSCFEKIYFSVGWKNKMYRGEDERCNFPSRNRRLLSGLYL